MKIYSSMSSAHFEGFSEHLLSLGHISIHSFGNWKNSILEKHSHLEVFHPSNTDDSGKGCIRRRARTVKAAGNKGEKE